MRLRHLAHPIAAAMAVAALTTCGVSQKPHAEALGVVPVQSQGLILQEGEGERRVRRNAGKGPFILKIDRQNGGSNDLVMGYEDIAPGVQIDRHMHLIADEILFVHRGSGVAQLGERESPVSAGTTIYVPHNVTISVRNTGKEPLGVAFIFSKPGFEEMMRENSVLEGQPVVPMSAEERSKVREKNSWHTVYPP